MDLRITLQKLEVLAEVVRQGGVGRAADSLMVAQPVVTTHVRTLEERLGAKIFYREGRQICLTEAGRAIYDWAEEVLTRTTELDRHLERLVDGQEGNVAVGASTSLGSYRLPHALTRYRANHPSGSVRLVIGDTGEMVHGLRRGVLDFAVIASTPNLVSPGLTVEQIAEDEIVLVAAADGEPSSDSISVEELATLSFIEAISGSVGRSTIDRQLREVGVVNRNIMLELGHPEAIKAAVLARIGPALLFRSAIQQELEEGTMRVVEIRAASMPVPIYLAQREDKSFTLFQQDLIDAIRTDLATSLGDQAQSAAPLPRLCMDPSHHRSPSPIHAD